jgi:hypothetical protein
MLIYVEPSSCGRDAALAAAASLARHLTIDVAMLVRDEEKSVSGGCYRDLLDLRNASLRLHGLDIRTETFRGSAPNAIKERLASSDERTLLVIAHLRSGAAISSTICASCSRPSPPAAVLFVSGRDEQDVQNIVVPRRTPRPGPFELLRYGVSFVLRRALIGAAFFVLWGCGAADDGAGANRIRLLNVSYDPTRELYRHQREVLREVLADTGQEVTVQIARRLRQPSALRDRWSRC